MSVNAPKYRAHAAVAVALVVSSVIMARANDHDGIVRVKSAYALDETISRIKNDIADKGIRFFSEIDQSKLAAGAGIKLRPSTLLVFGNPPLGTQFITCLCRVRHRGVYAARRTMPSGSGATRCCSGAVA